MVETNRAPPFVHAFEIRRGDVICLVGAGGKTSLMFLLAQQAKLNGFKVLVTTTTQIKVPTQDQYEAIDLSGMLFSQTPITDPGIYVGGKLSDRHEKICGANVQLLFEQLGYFDLILIEADGAATKPLKGWKESEPVIPSFTTKTIGVIDIQTIGKNINAGLVHRLNLFLEITGAEAGETFSIDHLLQLINHKRGLFQNSHGKKIIFFNKVESVEDKKHTDCIQNRITNLQSVAGSILERKIYDRN